VRRRLAWAASFCIVAVLGAGALALWRFAASLPSLDLTEAEHRSTVVLDRHDRLLRAFATPEGRWRLPVTHGDVDPRFLAMLKAYEDRRFDSHRGLDPLALVRASGQLVWNRRVVSGASTLTMQVARLLEPRPERNLAAKLTQAIRAVELERRFTKAELLDLYLRLAPYGGTLEGVRAASLSYFGKEPKRLSVGEAALLVALPQSPEARRPDRSPDIARRARDRVLTRVLAAGAITVAEAEEGRAERIPTQRHGFPMHAAHAAERAVLERPDLAIHRLTIDRRQQAMLEALLAERIEQFGSAVSGAIVLIDNETGEVRARVGSPAKLSAERRGAIDMTAALRSPGSALKPFIYALAFESGIAHPETLVDDRPSRWGAYAPDNFDLTFQGTVTARRALQSSLNLPAVELLGAIGPARFVARLRQAGAAVALSADAAPGLATGLGGLGITLIDLTRLYAGFAKTGMAPPLVTRLEPDAAPALGETRVTDAVPAWYVADILRGAPPPDHATSGRIAFKTGTSYGFRDAWSIGFDRKVTIGVWLGRPDGGSVPGLLGRTSAAPILFDAFSRLGHEPEPIPRPSGALMASTATLPPPLRHVRPDAPKTIAATVQAPLRIAFPVEGSRVDLGASRAGGPEMALALKASGGVPPMTWLVNGAPLGQPEPRRQASWMPDGAGFARVSVMDAKGATDSVVVRIE
jgi:penicillin-binding protein 1C